MARPSTAQLLYGVLTVVLSDLAMLLLSGARGTVGVAVIAVAAVTLGVLVAVTVRTPGAARARRPGAGAESGTAAGPAEVRVPAQHHTAVHGTEAA
ncbi:hypothetical protein [Streptomyces sp. NPDC058045]|uniref:hypothetical protein n=1 Tax=Streptomyces sp. NPDC058045 TaxID=3346311 RepID=UPI0036F0A4EF